MNKRTVHLEQNPELALMLAHVGEGYLTHAVEVRRGPGGGEPVAVLMDPEAARCALAIAERLRTRKPPFTQDALDRWLDDVLTGLDVPAFMSADPLG